MGDSSLDINFYEINEEKLSEEEEEEEEEGEQMLPEGEEVDISDEQLEQDFGFGFGYKDTSSEKKLREKEK